MVEIHRFTTQHIENIFKKGLCYKDKHVGMIAEGGYKFKKKYTVDAEERGDEVHKQMRGYKILCPSGYVNIIQIQGQLLIKMQRENHMNTEKDLCI